MKTFLRSFSLALPMIAFAMALHTHLVADQMSDEAAEKRRLEKEREEQKIYERKLEDQQYERRQQERREEERRQEKRKIDNARYRNLIAQRDRDRRDDFIDRDERDLTDDLLEERVLDRNYQANISDRQNGCGCNGGNRVEVIEQWDRDHSRD